MRYHPGDLDKLRGLIYESKMAYVLNRWGSASSPSSADVERELLTHMANGTTVEEMTRYLQDEKERGAADAEASRLAGP